MVFAVLMLNGCHTAHKAKKSRRFSTDAISALAMGASTNLSQGRKYAAAGCCGLIARLNS